MTNSSDPKFAGLKRKAALASIAASGCLMLGKLLAGLLSGSLALLSEAGHGLLDTGATILTYFAILAADKPADEEHHYGHGKIEAVVALAETGLLFVLATIVLIEAIRRLIIGTVAIDANVLAFAVLTVSILVDLVRWRSLARIAEQTNSDALAADALHFSSDFVSSILVLIGLGAAAIGYPQGDAAAALGVAVFIAIAGFRLGRRTIDKLLDAAPKGLARRIRAITQAVPGVVAIETIRLRPAGSQIIGDVGIAVPRTLPLERVLDIKEAVAEAISSELPEASVTVVANPRALDDETVLERVLLAAAVRRLPVHHVTVQEVDGRKCVSLDVELDGRMRHGDAHEAASGLEGAIRAELGPEIEVETHIEPLEKRELVGQDTEAAQSEGITAALARRAKEDGILRDVHSVRVRETAAGLVVIYHCRVDPALRVDEVHRAVDRLDRRVRADFPRITRIVGHAEPVRR